VYYSLNAKQITLATLTLCLSACPGQESPPKGDAATDHQIDAQNGTCVSGVRACQTGNPGVCATGTQRCTTAGTWDTCTPRVLPGGQVEICDNKLDDDCDGNTDAADSDCSEDCSAGQVRFCTLKTPGICSKGVQSCTLNGVWGTCSPTISPGDQPEICDNEIDDDCDGQIDAADSDCTVTCKVGQTRPCTTTNPGVCQTGVQGCSGAGAWDTCQPKVTPGAQKEICSNALDDDCDGQTDAKDSDCQGCPQGQSQSCNTNLPAPCQSGTQTCLESGGVWSWGDCTATATQPETTPANMCDGVDNNCNGVRDEGTFMSGPIQNMEYLPAASAALLFGQAHPSLLFLNWGDTHHAGLYAIWDLIAGMAQVGNARTFFNTFAGSELFAAGEPLITDAIMLAPAGSFKNAFLEESLIFFIDGKIKILGLNSKVVSSMNLADLAIPNGSGGVISDHITAATVMLASDFPTLLTNDLFLITRGDQCWLLAEGATAWSGPSPVQNCFCSASSTGCPSDLNNLTNLSIYRDAKTGEPLLTFSVGSMIYASGITAPQGALTYNWVPINISDISCQH
jgi:hypothetical protein